MVVLEFENYNGERIGNLQLEFDDSLNDYEIYDIEGEFDIADIEPDDIYETNDRKIRLQQNIRKEKVPFLSLNIESGSSPERAATMLPVPWQRQNQRRFFLFRPSRRGS